MTRGYESPKRQAQAERTRSRIVDAFVEQLADPDQGTLSPKLAAKAAGVSVRTVHHYFPDRESQIAAVAEWADTQFFPGGVELPEHAGQVPAFIEQLQSVAVSQLDLCRIFIRTEGIKGQIRTRRRTARLAAIADAIAPLKADEQRKAEVVAVLGTLAGGDIAIGLIDRGALPADRVPTALREAARALIDDLTER